MPRRGLARRADASPTGKSPRNFTDPYSHLMKSDGHYIHSYNCQLAVDSDHRAIGVSNQPPDAKPLEPMLERSQRKGMRRSGHRRHRPPAPPTGGRPT